MFLDNVTVSTIAEFLPFTDYPALRSAISQVSNIDRMILNPSYGKIPCQRAREYFDARKFGHAQLWVFMGSMISRKIYIGTVDEDEVDECIRIIHEAINLTYESLIKSDEKGWFLANYESPDIYEMVSDYKVIRLIPWNVTMKHITDFRELADIYPCDDVYAYIISHKYANGPDLRSFDDVDFPKLYPKSFKALVDLAIIRKYRLKYPIALPNIDAAIVNHLCEPSGSTEDGNVICKTMAVAIHDVLLHKTDDLYGDIDKHHLYAAYLVAFRMRVSITPRYKTIILFECASRATEYEKALVSEVLQRAKDARFNISYNHHRDNIEAYMKSKDCTINLFFDHPLNHHTNTMDANVLSIIADYLPITSHVTIALVFGDHPFLILRRRYSTSMVNRWRFNEIADAYVASPSRRRRASSRDRVLRHRADVILSSALRLFIVPSIPIMRMMTSHGVTMRYMIFTYIHRIPVEWARANPTRSYLIEYYCLVGMADYWYEAHPDDLDKITVLPQASLSAYTSSSFRDRLAIAMTKTNLYPWRYYEPYTSMGHHLRENCPDVFEAFVKNSPPLHFIPVDGLDDVIQDIIWERVIRRNN